VTDDLLERAKVIADATGRELADVLADLADDGILNNSHRSDKDLITQLQEAAQLIDTVQSINRQVNENTVLNGGDNKTEVKVETTLEGDIVDRAIASAQRKVENVKKLALVLAPVFLLISGGTMEGLGVINMFGSDESDDDHDDFYSYGGCLASDAENYDPMASWDDGSCYWNDNGNGNTCASALEWHNSDWWIENGDDAVLHPSIYDNAWCGNSFTGDIHVALNHDGEYYDEEWVYGVQFTDSWDQQFRFYDLPAGEYDAEVWFYSGGSSWHWNFDGHETVECDAGLYSKGSRIEKNQDQDLEVFMTIGANNDQCDTDVNVHLAFYLNNSYQFTIEEYKLPVFTIRGETEIKVIHPDMQGLEPGHWSAETRFIPKDEPEECCEMTGQVEVTA
jgi:hypothetical protein